MILASHAFWTLVPVDPTKSKLWADPKNSVKGLCDNFSSLARKCLGIIKWELESVAGEKDVCIVSPIFDVPKPENKKNKQKKMDRRMAAAALLSPL